MIGKQKENSLPRSKGEYLTETTNTQKIAGTLEQAQSSYPTQRRGPKGKQDSMKNIGTTRKAQKRAKFQYRF